jgi:hypothetical protein
MAMIPEITPQQGWLARDIARVQSRLKQWATIHSHMFPLDNSPKPMSIVHAASGCPCRVRASPGKEP